jgi:hypothetical protein
MLLSVAILTAGASNAEEISEPFQLDTLTGEKTNFYVFKNSLKPNPIFSVEEIFLKVENCYPGKSNFDFDLSAKLGYNGETDTQNGFYKSVLFTMPLYSTNENSRAREQEFKRRQALSELIADLNAQLTNRNLANRKLGLFEALEQREQLRVQSGITPLDIQVAYLEKLANEYANQEKANSEIDSIRLQLLAHCQNSKRKTMDLFLNNVIYQN